MVLAQVMNLVPREPQLQPRARLRTRARREDPANKDSYARAAVLQSTQEYRQAVGRAAVEEEPRLESIMKHLKRVSRMPEPALASIAVILPLGIKLMGVLAFIDRLLLGEDQSPWKTPF